MKKISYLSKQSNQTQTITNSNHGFPYCCFIIPEYMNKKIVEKGTTKQKELAWKNLILTEQLRGRRQVTGPIAYMLSASDKLHRTIYDAQKEENLPGTLILVE